MSQTESKSVTRVYLRGGATLRLTNVVGDPVVELRKVRGGVITGTDIGSGDLLSITTEDVTSIAQPPRSVPNPGIFWGRGIEIRSAAHFKDMDADPHSDAGLVRSMVPEDRMHETAVVIASDEASAVVVIYDLARDDAVWLNPASSPDAIEYAIQALKLLAIGEQVEQAFQAFQEQGGDVVHKGPFGAPNAELANVAFGVGDVAGAFEHHPAQAERRLAALSFSKEVEVRLSGLMNGWVGTISGYEDPQEGQNGGRFTVDLTAYEGKPTSAGSTAVAIEDIKAITCWDVEDRRLTENADRILTQEPGKGKLRPVKDDPQA